MVKARLIIFCCVLFSLWTSVSVASDFIIDTDMGVDDVIAIVYMLNRPDVHVKAITIASDGITHCAPARRNLAGLLQLMNRAEIPVACGRALPLSGHNHFPADLLQKSDDLEGAAKLLPRTKITPRGSALRLLEMTLQNASRPMDVLAIGPLTNLAELFSKNPAIKNKIRRIYVMGGAIHVSGNVALVDPTINNTAAEWNFYFDPEAADIVFRSGVPLTLVPLDLTNQLPIDKEFYHSLVRHHSTSASQFIFELFKRNQQMLDTHQWYFWDPLAAVIATDESVARMRKEKLRIVRGPLNKEGATVVSERGNWVDVCWGVDKKRFKDMLLRFIGG